MIFPVIDAEVWAGRYDLRIQEGACRKCKCLLKTDVAFAMEGWRGLKSKTHECGEVYDLVVLVPVDKKEINFIKDAYQELTSSLRHRVKLCHSNFINH